MSPLAIVLMVVGILVGVAAINLAIWIPILRKLKRMPAALRAELADERIVVEPERASYRGATAIYGRAGGIGVAALTDRRLAFRKAVGKPIDVPIDQIAHVREVRRQLVIATPEGTTIVFRFSSNDRWLGALRDVAEASR